MSLVVCAFLPDRSQELVQHGKQDDEDDLADKQKALKAAQVRIAAFYGPPSPTNFGGGLLTGSQSDCRAACEAFARAVIDVANAPISWRER